MAFHYRHIHSREIELTFVDFTKSERCVFLLPCKDPLTSPALSTVGPGFLFNSVRLLIAIANMINSNELSTLVSNSQKVKDIDSNGSNVVTYHTFSFFFLSCPTSSSFITT